MGTVHLIVHVSNTVLCFLTKFTKDLGTIVRMLLVDQVLPHENVQVGNDQEKAQSEINSHSKNRDGKN